MRAIAVTIAISVGTLSSITAAVMDDCPCGYTDANGVYTEIQETDFTTVKDLMAVQNGWQIQEWNVSANPASSVPYGRSMSRTNVVASDAGLNLVVHPERDGVVSGAEIIMLRDDVRYGSFRVGLKIPPVNGTCASFFWVCNFRFLSKACQPLSSTTMTPEKST
jgi:hypothetical protein